MVVLVNGGKTALMDSVHETERMRLERRTVVT